MGDHPLLTHQKKKKNKKKKERKKKMPVRGINSREEGGDGRFKTSERHGCLDLRNLPRQKEHFQPPGRERRAGIITRAKADGQKKKNQNFIRERE